MTQGQLESIPLPFEQVMSEMEMRVMEDVVRAIRINGFSTSTADAQMKRLIQFGQSRESIKEWIKEALDVADAEMEKIFSDTVYEQYYGYKRAYEAGSVSQISFEGNRELQDLISAVKVQTRDTFRNMTNSMGFALRNPSTGRVYYTPLMEFYQDALSGAVMDITTGAASYDKALGKVINAMTVSGLRWIDYDSGVHSRVNVAARRAVMTGFRQIQGKMNEQVAKDLGTDYFEVSYHIGARPEHQVWQGKVYTYNQLEEICGLGTVTGLHGANCYHDYNAFILGVSVRTYTDEQLEQMMAEENRPKAYNGKEYTMYEALQEQRRLETVMRKTRQDIKLLQEGEAGRDTVTVKKCRYQVQMQQYKSFSKAMGLPEQMQRVYQDGLGRMPVASEKKKLPRMKISIPEDVYGKSKMTKKVKNKIEGAIRKLEKEYIIYLDRIEGEYINSGVVFLAGGYIDEEGVLRHSLVINYKKDFTKLEKRMQRLYNEGKLAGKSYEDYVAHEMAHIIPFQNCVTAEDYEKTRSELKKQFVYGVSEYADRSRDGAESLAEAFVKYRNGEKIPDESRKLIEKYIFPWRR